MCVYYGFDPAPEFSDLGYYVECVDICNPTYLEEDICCWMVPGTYKE